MTPSDFCYWLQGWAEMEDGKKPSMEQWKLILSHLDLVFEKITPSLEDLVHSFEEMDWDDESVAGDDMTDLLEKVVDGLPDEPATVVFNPPGDFRPPQSTLDDTLICSPDPKNDISFCTNGLGQRVPRNIRND